MRCHSSLSLFRKTPIHLDPVYADTQCDNSAVWFDRVSQLYRYVQHSLDLSFVQIRVTIFGQFEHHMTHPFLIDHTNSATRIIIVALYAINTTVQLTSSHHPALAGWFFTGSRLAGLCYATRLKRGCRQKNKIQREIIYCRNFVDCLP